MRDWKHDKALHAASDTEDLIISPGCIDKVPEVLEKRFGQTEALIVADENTFAVAGRAVERSLKGSVKDTLVFPGEPELPADYSNVEIVRNFLKDKRGGIVAVGSGTINDLVKVAAYQTGRRYLVVPTAASVDGYAAFGAAITREGYKQTLSCPAPASILADTAVLQTAPAPMTAAGYGDLAGKVTAGADWIIADILSIESIDPLSWELVQQDLRSWIAKPADLAKGDSQALETLFEGLIISGFAMQSYRGTRPASGTEHLFSHLWEMLHLELDGRAVSHGFKVSLGSLAATAFTELVFSRNIEKLDIERRCAEWPSREERASEVTKLFSQTPICEQVVSTSLAKHIDGDSLREKLKAVKSSWNLMKEKVEAQLLPYSEIKALLSDAGCPTRPEHIGLSKDSVRGIVRKVQMIRDRYTVLDLAFELGWLEDCAEELYSSTAYLT